MRTVLKPQDVAHAWANQTQDNARTANGSLYYEGETIYSYGRHFAIAKHVTNKKGEKAVLFTTRRYSNITAKHIHVVRHASNHLNLIFCNDPLDSTLLNMESFLREIKGELSGLSNARKPEKYIFAAEQVQHQAHKYAEFFGLKTKEIDQLIESAKGGKYAEYLKKEAARIQREKVKKEKEVLKQHLAAVEKWRNFEGSNVLYSRGELVDYLRINTKTNRIETSQGVEIPVAIAQKVYNWIKSTSECAGNCNYKILDFEVTELTREHLTAGCHKILMTEIEKIATTLNWIN